MGLGLLMTCMALPQSETLKPNKTDAELKIKTLCTVIDTKYKGARSESSLGCDSIQGRVQIRQQRYARRYHPGQVIRLDGTLAPQQSAHNPGEYDPKEIGLYTGLMWTFKGRIKSVDGRDNIRFETHLKLWARNTLDEGKRGYGRVALKGILLGERQAVPKNDIQSFRATGTGHLLAVSGLHIGALCWSVWWLFNLMGIKLRLIYPGRVATFAALIAIWTLVFLAQNPLSAKRAALMLSLALFARAIGWRTNVLRLISIALVWVIAESPVNLTNIGFQYSFLTVVSLSLISKNKSRAVSALTISTAASVAAWVVECWHFGTLTLSAPICNLILVPVASLAIVPLGLIGLILSPISQLPLDCVASLTELFLGLAGALADLFGYPIIVGRHWSPMLLAILMLYLVRLNWVSKLLLISVMVFATIDENPEESYVDFVYVGQGDATLLVSDGSAALVDTGGPYDVRRLLGHLSRQGIRKLEWVLITHHHPDHYGGLGELIKMVQVGHVFHVPPLEKTSHWVTMVSAMSGQSFRHPDPVERLGRFTIHNLLPTENSNASENDRSIALRVTLASSSLMLTGDLESFGERRLVAMGVPPSDALQLGHHGSRTSSTQSFLQAVSPQLAIASCGVNNRYGFPHHDVVARLKSNGIKLLTTAINGWIRLIPAPSGWLTVSMRSSN